jgi:hypothetical protein
VRLSELLHRDVLDANGDDLGSIDDVLVVQDGPLVEGFGARPRVVGVVVGRSAIGTRLGVHRNRVKGPWPLTTMLGALERRAHFVPWEDVLDPDESPLRVRGDRAGYGPPPPLP